MENENERESLPVYLCKRLAPSMLKPGPDSAKQPWVDAMAISPFMLSDGSASATRQTIARMMWDNWGLWVHFRCQDPVIWHTLTKDNDPIYNEEVVEVFIDTDSPDDIYHEFELSPANVRFAARIRNAARTGRTSSIDQFLDCSLMQTKVLRPEDERFLPPDQMWWAALMGIPWKLIEVDGPPSPGDEWRANLYRIDRPPPDQPDLFPTEFSAWNPTMTPRPEFHWPDRFGIVKFVE